MTDVIIKNETIPLPKPSILDKEFFGEPIEAWLNTFGICFAAYLMMRMIS